MKRVVVLIVIIIIAMQFYRPYKNVSKNVSNQDFLYVESAPLEIRKIFEKSCYDCHSDNTHYSWYDNIAPLSWYVDKHIKRAKFSLNFSKWGEFQSWRRYLFFQGGITYDLSKGKMPPKNYLFLHPNAKVSQAEKILIESWIKSRY